VHFVNTGLFISPWNILKIRNRLRNGFW
jgi:hypothetical protein